MTEFQAIEVILKDEKGNYLIPYVGDIGGGYPIGAMVTSLTPLNDANFHLFDGALLTAGGMYNQFINKFISELFVDHPECFITESEWQQQVTTYGVCDKYVYTPNVSVRLPKLGNQIFTQNDKLSVQGNGMTLGLTNGTLNAGLKYSNSGLSATQNAYGENIGTSYSAGLPSSNLSMGVTTDPTKSGIEANLQSTTNCYYYICVSSKTKTDIQSNIDNIATDLNNKADKDLTNVANKLSDNFFSKISFDYANKIEILLKNNDETSFTAPTIGYVSGFYRAYNIDLTVKINDIIMQTTSSGAGSGFAYPVFYLINKGDVIKIRCGKLLEKDKVYFSPVKGAN